MKCKTYEDVEVGVEVVGFGAGQRVERHRLGCGEVGVRVARLAAELAAQHRNARVLHDLRSKCHRSSEFGFVSS